MIPQNFLRYNVAMTTKKLRIQGLVRFERALRRQMALGFTPAERRQWQDNTLQVLQQVQEICQAQRITVEDFPAPSRRAVRFLTTIPWNTLPERADPAGGSAPQKKAAPPKTIGVSNAIAQANARQRDFQALAAARHPRPEEKTRLLEQLRDLTAQLETIARQAGGQPADFRAPTRRAYAWFRFLSDAEHFQSHLDTLRRFLRLWPADRQPEVNLYNGAALYRARRRRDGHWRITLSEGFSGAPLRVLQALKTVIEEKASPTERQRLQNWVAGEAFQTTLRTLQDISMAGSRAARGLVYDLEELFDELNARYFDGTLTRPHLIWSRRAAQRTFGHYKPATDTITLSRRLDDPAVPREVVAFVLYHEMLHKAMGVKRSKGRRYVHTPDFRRRERVFEHYEEAQAVLRTLALAED